MRKIKGSDTGQLYAMKVLKKATLKGNSIDASVTFTIITNETNVVLPEHVYAVFVDLPCNLREARVCASLIIIWKDERAKKRLGNFLKSI